MVDVQKIELKKLVLDPDIQQRAEINQDVVKEYSECVDDLPPITVYCDGSKNYVVKGFHRYHAHVKAKAGFISCEVVFGTKRDAILVAVGDNARHGLRRSIADKRKAVTTLLDDAEWSERSANWIAETAGVSYSFAKGMVDERRGREGKSTGKDGNEYRNSRKPAATDKRADPEPVAAVEPDQDWAVDASDEGGVEPERFRPDGPDDRERTAVDSREWSGVSPEVAVSPHLSQAIEKEVDKHFGALVRAIDSLGDLKRHDANWREFHKEAVDATNVLGRRLAAWKSHPHAS